MKPFEQDPAALLRELIRLNLIDATQSHHQQNAIINSDGNRKFEKNKNKRRKIRQVSSSVSNNSAGQYGINAHLKGSELEQIIKETRDKLEKERM